MRYFLPMLAAGAALSMAAAAGAADTQFKLLVLAMPNKYHYEYIPIARASLEQLARLHNFDLVYTNRPDSFEGDLKQYGAIVLLNTAGEELNPAQRTRFEAYMNGGGNAVIVHRAMIAPKDGWVWYEKLVGRSFTIHPIVQTAAIDTVDSNFPAAYGVPQRWMWSDEWYELTNPYKVENHTVLKVDESSYDPTRIWPGQVAHGMGAEHPVAWYRTAGRSGQGRVFVTTLGHNAEMYRDPQYLGHLMGGIWWAATGKGQRPAAALKP
ncbi:ThuA domain-containing protein [Massilia phyllosphaerae]|uniref:ThuA domain-containing protein n=1 Tax=Massilia phyllosphaerae TaxID=3106034 RepID=UPI002B1CB03E|nr:ThuA domain-containing protein [Massilia sp. SGZ-792]